MPAYLSSGMFAAIGKKSLSMVERLEVTGHDGDDDDGEEAEFSSQQDMYRSVHQPRYEQRMNNNHLFIDDIEEDGDDVQLINTKKRKRVTGSSLVKDPVKLKKKPKKKAEQSYDDGTGFINNVDDFGDYGSSSGRKKKEEDEEHEDEHEEEDEGDEEWRENNKNRPTVSRLALSTRKAPARARQQGTLTLVPVAGVRESRHREAKRGASYIIDLNDDEDDVFVEHNLDGRSGFYRDAKKAAFKTPFKIEEHAPEPSWLHEERAAMRSGLAYQNIHKLQQKIATFAKSLDNVVAPSADAHEKGICHEVRRFASSTTVGLLYCRIGSLRHGSGSDACCTATVNHVDNKLEMTFVYDNPYCDSADACPDHTDSMFGRHLDNVNHICADDRGAVTSESLDMAHIKRVLYFQLSPCVDTHEATEHVVLVEIEIEPEAKLFRYFKTVSAGRDKLFDPITAAEGDPRRYIALHMTMISMNRLLQELRLCTSWVETVNGEAAATYRAVNDFSILSGKRPEVKNKTLKAYFSNCQALDDGDKRNEILKAAAEELKKLERAKNRKNLGVRSVDTRGNEIYLTYPFASHDAVENGDVVVERDSVIIFKKDLTRFNDREYFNDALVDLKSKLVLDRLAQGPHSALRPVVHIFTCNLFIKLNPDQEQGSEVGYSFVSRWTKKIDVFALRFILFPVNYGNHWSLAVVVNPGALYAGSSVGSSEKCRFLFMDPMNIHDISKVYDIVLSYLGSEFEHKKKASGLDFTGDMAKVRCAVPQQSNSYDCGVFVAKYIETFVAHICSIDYTGGSSVWNENADNHFGESCLKDSFVQNDVTRERQLYRGKVEDLARQWREYSASREGCEEEEDSQGALLLGDTKTTNHCNNTFHNTR